jgi:hypothetical protein
VRTGICVIKTFITGIVLGIAGVLTALYFVPVIDQHREISVVEVLPNGGNSESFKVNIPTDRILIGDQDSNVELPPGLVWPDDPKLAGSRTELFKLRNSRNAVIGVASRLAASSNDFGNIIEWVVHLPARGSMYFVLSPEALDGARSGQMRAGTREFSGLIGKVSERWVADASGGEGTPVGRIELVASFVSARPVDDAAYDEDNGVASDEENGK